MKELTNLEYENKVECKTSMGNVIYNYSDFTLKFFNHVDNDKLNEISTLLNDNFDNYVKTEIKQCCSKGSLIIGKYDKRFYIHETDEMLSEKDVLIKIEELVKQRFSYLDFELFVAP